MGATKRVLRRHLLGVLDEGDGRQNTEYRIRKTEDEEEDEGISKLEFRITPGNWKPYTITSLTNPVEPKTDTH
jgi:hypothetical protein